MDIRSHSSSKLGGDEEGLLQTLFRCDFSAFGDSIKGMSSITLPKSIDQVEASQGAPPLDQ